MLLQAALAAMVGVAQLAERQVVVLDVVGSSPIVHPKSVQVTDLTPTSADLARVRVSDSGSVRVRFWEQII
jgi:hypothetical protein